MRDFPDKDIPPLTPDGLAAYLRTLDHRDQALGQLLLHCANSDDVAPVENLLDEHQVPIDFSDEETGLVALHIAVGRDRLDMAKYLVEKGASFLPDNQGRMPTTIAAECEVSDEMCDFIAEAEAKAEGV
jgi:ankyrin repeat protein